MRIAVFGSGGVGGYFGGRLAQAGEDVTFIARGDHLLALQAGGLNLESAKGDLHIPSVTATDDPNQVGPVDIVLLAVKAWHNLAAIQSMHPLIGADTGVVPLGNGVEAPDQLVEAFGTKHAMGGLCRISSFIAAPGKIKQVGIDPIVLVGELDNHRSARLAALREALERAGVNANIPEDIQAAMWEKFIFIAAVSGLGALTRSPAGVFRSQPALRSLLAGMIAESEQVGRSRGVNLPPDVAAKTLMVIDSLPYETHASMVRDILAGRPSELEAQNGAVVHMGEMEGIPTPFNQFIYACLLPQEMKARGEI
jgi:2-dehydropantoate 2-reductase